MKTKSLISRNLHSLICALFLSFAATAFADMPSDDVMEMDISTNLETPTVTKRFHNAVKNHIAKQGNALLQKGIPVKYQRDGEVIEVTIPCERLFAPNEWQLLPSACPILDNFKTFAKSQLYKIIVAVHSDNTGDEQYADELTEHRANTIDRYFSSITDNADINLIPYGMGMDEPLNNNRTRIEREANRRVQIYIVPDSAMIEQARIGKLN